MQFSKSQNLSVHLATTELLWWAIISMDRWELGQWRKHKLLNLYAHYLKDAYVTNVCVCLCISVYVHDRP